MTTFYTDRALVTVNGLNYANNGNIKSIKFTSNYNTNFVPGMTSDKSAAGGVRGNGEHTITIEEFIQNSGGLIDWASFDFETNSVQVTISSASASYANPAPYNGQQFVFSGVFGGDEDVTFGGQGQEATRSFTFKACSRTMF